MKEYPPGYKFIAPTYAQLVAHKELFVDDAADDCFRPKAFPKNNIARTMWEDFGGKILTVRAANESQPGWYSAEESGGFVWPVELCDQIAGLDDNVTIIGGAE